MLLYGFGFGYPMFYGFDRTYLLVLVAAIFSMWASARVNSTYSKYAKVRSMQGLTGAEAAQRILYYAGLSNIRVEHVSGNLTDHYDPKSKVLRLSDSTYSSASVAAIGVAAHECGHAIQDAEGYSPLRLRSTLVPAANLGSRLGIPIILLGVLLGSNYTLVQVGIWVFSLAVLFQLVTLPVEFNASNRAMRILGDRGMLGQEELGMCKKVLSAAAMTYVAAAASSIIQLLRLVLLFGRRRDD
ncbi:MAG: zinc metallopeptidase [Lachnospiraceae bacterium]|nr:zinc metallopeptidase [Lachnospiraceae bacterium]MBR4060879.1 zinc metallopeptidase [Lachnospiraceae bacterium]